MLDQLVLTNRLCWHHRIFRISPAISICFCLLAMHCKSLKGWECENEWGSDGDRETKEPWAVCDSPLGGVVGAAATHTQETGMNTHTLYWNDNWVHLVLIWMHTSTHIQTPPILISIPQRSPPLTSLPTHPCSHPQSHSFYLDQSPPFSFLTIRSFYLSVSSPLFTISQFSLIFLPPPPVLLLSSGLQDFWSASVLDMKSLPLTLRLPPHLSQLSHFSMQQRPHSLYLSASPSPILPLLPL